MGLYGGTTRYVYKAGGKEFDSLGAALAELSRIRGYAVTDVHTYDVTTMEDGANGFEVYLVWVDPPVEGDTYATPSP